MKYIPTERTSNQDKAMAAAHVAIDQYMASLGVTDEGAREAMAAKVCALVHVAADAMVAPLKTEAPSATEQEIRGRVSRPWEAAPVSPDPREPWHK